MPVENDENMDFMTEWKRKKEQQQNAFKAPTKKGGDSNDNTLDDEKDFMTFFKSKKERENKGSAIGELINRVKEAEAKQKSLEIQNKELKKKLESNLQFMEKAEKLIQTATSAEERLRNELETFKKENEGLKKELGQKTAILNEFEDKIKDIEIKIKMYSTKINELTAENNALKQMMVKQGKEITSSEDGTLVIQLKNEIKELKRIIEEKDKIIGELMNI
ncbi:MAG: hypothetical protein ACTSU4_15110 [Promethearchaeota archaeon]